MREDQPNTELLAAWRSGDERAAEILFHRYLARLTALVRSRLSSRFARRIDPEDIVLSAWRSFFVGANDGRFLTSPDGEIWPLLVTITLRKLSKQTRIHSADQRDVGRESASDRENMAECLANDPSPEDAALVADALEQLLNRLDPLGTEVLLRQLNGSDTASIAKELDCSERTVRRVSQRLRGQLRLNDARQKDSAGQAEAAVTTRSRILSTHSLEQLTLHELVGQGAFSKVFRATETTTSQRVAVKFLRKSMWSDSRSRQSILREYAALRAIKHPNVLRVHGWGESPAGGLFLVAEYLDGETLDRRQRDVGTTLHVLRVVAEALCFVHSQGLIHGDLKPANIFQTTANRLVLMDFGMARWFQRVDDQPPRGGTAGFLSPEQISPAFGDLTERTDIYAWGALAHALVTGRPPFNGSDLPETLAMVLSAPASALAAQNPLVPHQLDTLVSRCLARSPAERPTSMREIVDGLAGL